MNKLIKEPLSNFDLNDLLKDINETIGERKGINIFTVEQMMNNPKLFNDKLNKNGYSIVFLNPENGKIGHWIIIFKNQKGEKYMFDSYGNHPKDLDDNLFLFLKKYYPDIIYNTFQYQKYSSDVATCGRWSMFVLAMNKLIKNLDVDVLHEILKELKRKYKNKSYDYIITHLVNFNL